MAEQRRIDEHAIIGDLHTVALVAVDGTISFLCAPSFDCSEFDLRKFLKKIQQRYSQVTRGERCTEANCESASLASTACPCSGSKRIQLLDYRARYLQEVASGRRRTHSTT